MPYTIQIPVEVTAGRAFTLTLRSGSAQWACLEPAYANGQTIAVPADQFHFRKRVPDELRFVYRGGGLLPVTEPRPARAGCVVVAAESPHLHEYSAAFEPIGPLRNARTQTRIRNYLPGLLQRADTPDDTDVMLVNPIQYQTSLVRLWRPEFRSKMLSLVRDTVWTGLWGASTDGVRVFEADFLARMAGYQPWLTVNACTAGVKHLVDAALRGQGYRVAGVTEHPSYWNSKSRLVQ